MGGAVVLGIGGVVFIILSIWFGLGLPRIKLPYCDPATNDLKKVGLSLLEGRSPWSHVRMQ